MEQPLKEPLWKSSQRLNNEHFILQYDQDIRQEQCLMREYLIRQPILPIPAFIHARIAWQDYVANEALNQLHITRRPRLEFPPVSAVIPWLKSLVYPEEYLCWKCRKIDFNAVFRSSGGFEPFTLLCYGIQPSGNVSKCQFCRLLYHITCVLARDPTPWPSLGLELWTLDVEKDELALYQGGTRRGQIRLELKRTTRQDDDQRQRLNVSALRRWLSECEQEHEGLCQNNWPGLRYSSPIDLLLIDVHEKRLVRAKSDQKYAALSYVWGQAKTLLTTKLNVQDLQEPGGLANTDIPIARVILDTMSLVEDMGERYLWADTLCIVHDDENNKMEAIRSMDIVYAHARFTVVDASGHSADDGLPGINHVPRPLLGLRQMIKDIPLIWTGSELSDILRYSPHETRAWTLQEKLMSRRCLYITQHQAYLFCFSDYKCEDYFDDKLRLKGRDRGQEMPIPENPLFTLYEHNRQRSEHGVHTWSYCIYIYRRLVRAYTRRSLSYQSDALNAFQGIIGALVEVCQGRFTHGLPEEIFDLALLWVSTTDWCPQRRTEGGFPSWAWAGWTGAVDYTQHFPVHILGTPLAGEGFPPNNGFHLDDRATTQKHLSPEEVHSCRHHEFKFLSEVNDFAVEEHGCLKTIKRSGAGVLYGSILDYRFERITSSRLAPLTTSEVPCLPDGQPLLHFVASTTSTLHFTLADPETTVQYRGMIKLYFDREHCGTLFGDFEKFGGLGLHGGRQREFILLSRNARWQGGL